MSPLPKIEITQSSKGTSRGLWMLTTTVRGWCGSAVSGICGGPQEHGAVVTPSPPSYPPWTLSWLFSYLYHPHLNSTADFPTPLLDLYLLSPLIHHWQHWWCLSFTWKPWKVSHCLQNSALVGLQSPLRSNPNLSQALLFYPWLHPSLWAVSQPQHSPQAPFLWASFLSLPSAMAFSLFCTESLPIVQSLTQMPPPPWSFPNPPAGNRPLYFTCARVTLFLWKLWHRPRIMSPLHNCDPLQGRDQVTFILVWVHMWKEDWTKSRKPLRHPIFMTCRHDAFLI